MTNNFLREIGAAVGFILSLFLRNKALSTRAGLAAQGEVDEPDAPFRNVPNPA
ncbi:hypothetical protein MUG78_07340 [Gordonia alkaliphila]|uniref:Uncharacterized protein n=1 Tax=Gordonia alkaliphila TaxID=1053547 RepID=A0ABP8YZT5_9ACTN|nr:hypothetical protein [Gordonia alkaliphila]MCK0439282.1 hypothetical protein [Gordonia alkaliphila]